ncbi:serpin family protein [Cohnella phaseoli]|uniref:Serpin B n=1 Tax=Cohnella phaseoli TaxID=456490 RepID=A0A3D9JV31_9BACL|nr:serpin family protein [Cohnella phaseoli]RED77407.1 serpin B [Cohnella phaseoli]
MRKTALGIGLAAVLACSGCGNRDEGASPEVKSERKASAYTAQDVDPALVQASNGFGLSLMEKLMADTPGENVLLSPLSLSSALSLVATGGEGKTEEEMRGALGLGERTKDEIGAGYRVLVDLLSHPGEDGVEMNVFSSLWLKEGKPFHDTFVNRSRNDFRAEVSRVNFAEPQTLETMNEWAKEATAGRIERLLEGVEADAAMYVLNAVYFNGAWTKPFSAEKTTDGQFHISDGETVPAKMMANGGYYPYAQKEEYEAIRLPYGKRESAYMTILLPDKDVSLSKVAAMLAADPDLLTEEYEVRKGSIEIPKLRLEYSTNATDALRQAGIIEALEPTRADFSAMAPEPPNLFISKVAHRATLSVDEQGTEAAAATVIEMMAGAAPADEPFQMKVDRPFIAAIVDRATGCILFAGAVSDLG